MLIFVFLTTSWHKKSMYVKIVQGNAHKRVFCWAQTGKFRNCLMRFPRTKNDNFCFGDPLLAQKGHTMKIMSGMCVQRRFLGGRNTKIGSCLMPADQK